MIIPVEISLPTELRLEQQIDLVRDYVQEQFVNRGMIADITINKPPKTKKGEPRNSDPRNTYAQILLTTRYIDSNGFGRKDRKWNSKKLLDEWRLEWENHANRALEKAGRQERIEHRSLASRNLKQKPNPPASHNSSQLNQKQKDTTSQEPWKKNYKLVSIRREFEFLVSAYAVWLKGQPIDKQSYEKKLKEQFKNKPTKDKKLYEEWAKTVVQTQDEFLAQLEIELDQED